jgi:fructoselysine-6-P-deglycase FrlB-like protein
LLTVNITLGFTEVSTDDILTTIVKYYRNQVYMTQALPAVEQLENESKQDYIKFLVFVAMGSTRTLNKAYRQFYETTHDVSQAWRTLADKYQWVERAADYDKRNA